MRLPLLLASAFRLFGASVALERCTVRDPYWTDKQAAALSAIFTPGQVYDIAADMAAQMPGLVRGMFTASVSEADYQ
ncbi:hypothetical protein MFIFM68171_09546 [Madurella fahalii]|uniref:Uncharacterized protein n=1 Tax=Madurella fahalii TaxID=1157608 RepID=A0ABQ0GNJ1_9PEZI